MNYIHIANDIIAMRDADLQLRELLIQRGVLGENYHPEMSDLHNRNAKKLEEIIEIIGYPTIDKVGQEANQAAWLIIQHAIGQPDFMRNCCELLQEAVSEKNADPVQLAYLSDRIATFEGRFQLYGTSFDWDHNGELSPKPYDDKNKVNERRKLLGLISLEEQTQIIRKQAKEENHRPPKNLDERNEAFNKWRKKVGWIV